MIRRVAVLLTVGSVPATAHAHSPDCAADVSTGVAIAIGVMILVGLLALFVRRVPKEVAWQRRVLGFVVVTTFAAFGGIGVWIVLAPIGYLALCG